MSFSKAFFLSSLTCFTLGVASGFSCSTDVNSGNSWGSAVNCINSNGGGTVTFEVDSYSSGSPNCLDYTTNIVSSFSGGTTLVASGSTRYICVNNESAIVTLGPSGSQPFSFDMTSSANLQVAMGQLIFGPNVIYPTNSQLGIIKSTGSGVTDSNSFVEFQNSGTVGSLVQMNPGTLYISGNSTEVTFSNKLLFGGTSVLKGDSSASKCISVPDAGLSSPFQFNTFTIQNITLQINETNSTSGNLSMKGDAVLEATNGLTLSSPINISIGPNTVGCTVSGQKLVLSGVISGSDGLTVTGPGKVHLEGANTYSGGTTIDGGILAVSGSSGNTGGGPISMANGAILDIQTNMTLSESFSGSSAGAGTISIDGSYILTLNGNFSGEGLAFSATSPNVGTVVFNGSAAGYSGQLALTNIDFSVGSGTSSLSNANLSLNTSTFNLGSNDVSIGNLSGNNSSFVTLGSGTLTMNFSNTTASFDAIISGSGGVVYQLDFGNTGCTVSPGATNTYTGSTTINNGIILNVVSDDNLGSGGAVTINGGGTLSVNPSTGGSSVTLDRGLVMGAGVGTVNLANSANVTLSGALSGSGDLSVEGASTGAGSLTLSSAAPSYTGEVTIDNATLKIAAANYLGTNQTLKFPSGGELITTAGSAVAPLDLVGGIQIGSLDTTFSPASDTVLELSGTITNTGENEGGIIFAGGGTTIVSGSNAYRGDTTLNFGTVQITQGANLGNQSNTVSFEPLSGSTVTLNIQGNITSTRGMKFEPGDSTINVGSGFTATFTGGVDIKTGIPTLEKTGQGILEIRPTSKSKLPQIRLVVSEGPMTGNTLFLENSSINLSALNSVFTFSEEQDGFYFGANSGATISGEGSIVIAGSSDLVFLVPISGGTQLYNSYTGETVLQHGTLIINADATVSEDFGILGAKSAPLTGAGGTLRTVVSFATLHDPSSATTTNFITSNRNVSLTADTATRFNTDVGTTLELGLVSGDGDLIKEGEGTLILAAHNTYTGVTVVEEGAFQVTGSIPKSNIVITPTGTLRGSGIIKEAKILGHMAAGASIGTLEVLEDLEFGPGSILSVEFNDLGNASLVTVDGSVAIAPGAVLLTVPQKGEFVDELEFTALEADGVIVGEFTRAVVPTIAYMEVVAEYTEGAVIAKVTPLSVTVTDGNSNAGAIASSINDAITWNRANVDISVQGNDVSGTGKIEGVLATLLPLQGTDETNVALEQMSPAPLKDLVVSQENASVQVQESLSTRLNEEMETLDCARTRHAYTFWINGMGSSTNQVSNTYKGSPQVGYNNTMAGFIAGVDYRFIDLLYAGALGGFTSSHVSFNGDRGAGDINTGYLGLYLSAIGEGFFANVSVTGGWNGYQANRRIQYTNVDLTASNNHGGRQLMTHLEGGLNLPAGRFNIRPFDRFDYLSQQEYGYKEKGAGDFDLSVNKNTSILIRNELGLQFASCFQVKTGKITLSPKVSWVREMRVRGSKYTAAFADAEDFSFSVTGYFPNRSLFSTGGVITGSLLEDKLSLSAYYDGEFVSGYSAHRYGGEVRVSF